LGEKLKISIILAHPNKGSFNHAIAYAAAEELRANNHEVSFHDLYEEKFDPILSSKEIASDGMVSEKVEEHCQEICEADGIIIVHPNWWGQPPAILKGWVDRVFRPGVAYNFHDGDNGEGIPVGLLKAKVGIVFNTSNTLEERENNIFGDPLELIWKKCIFELCGVDIFYREMFRVVVTSTQEQREIWLQKVKDTISSYYKIVQEA
jgi:putative NADPH-quinone reductase